MSIRAWRKDMSTLSDIIVWYDVAHHQFCVCVCVCVCEGFFKLSFWIFIQKECVSPSGFYPEGDFFSI